MKHTFLLLILSLFLAGVPSEATPCGPATLRQSESLGRLIKKENPGGGGWTLASSDGTQQIEMSWSHGTTTRTQPDGTVITQKPGPDPRFGMLSPVTEDKTLLSMSRMRMLPKNGSQNH